MCPDRIRRGARCPTCKGPVQWSGNRARPFCSVRCKLIDLGAWLDEAHRLPGPPLGPEPGEPEGPRREPPEPD